MKDTIDGAHEIYSLEVRRQKMDQYQGRDDHSTPRTHTSLRNRRDHDRSGASLKRLSHGCLQETKSKEEQRGRLLPIRPSTR